MSKYNHLSLLINNIMKEIRGYYWKSLYRVNEKNWLIII
jgi:hypothetical protein